MPIYYGKRQGAGVSCLGVWCLFQLQLQTFIMINPSTNLRSSYVLAGIGPLRASLVQALIRVMMYLSYLPRY